VTVLRGWVEGIVTAAGDGLLRLRVRASWRPVLAVGSEVSIDVPAGAARIGDAVRVSLRGGDLLEAAAVRLLQPPVAREPLIRPRPPSTRRTCPVT
jgi:hypothetical protein